MNTPHQPVQGRSRGKTFSTRTFLLVLLSIGLQLILALFLGHAYDMRIFMSTGYLVGTGQDPYIARDLSTVFHNASFQGITTFGYPPPWALVLGLIYLVSYKLIPNFLIYNLAIKIPLIAANLGLAYLVQDILIKRGAATRVSRGAWIFFLFNPFLLSVSSAWGQFDAIVALLALLALVLLDNGRLKISAFVLALAVCIKPTALPLLLVAFVYLLKRPYRRLVQYFGVALACFMLLCVAPFAVLRWDATPILQHWNVFFTVGGGISFMTFLELIQGSYQLTGAWAVTGMLWVPALAIATLALMRSGIDGFPDLLMKSTALVMVFFLARSWVSEPNIVLILPMVVILTSLGELNELALTFMWVLPLIFSVFNTSTIQLLFPSLPGLMGQLLSLSGEFYTARLIARVIVVIPWLMAGVWIVRACFRKAAAPLRPEAASRA
ncbi:MAG: glycosyltransferase 87 family protein [Anaerolineales bacterium]|jgi:Gpi18-like mannosyltransferase